LASGFTETDRVRKAQALGAGEYLKKPYTMDKIGLAVRNALTGVPCERAVDTVIKET
jgi:DNA-binding NarL/FixJ family response regulator